MSIDLAQFHKVFLEESFEGLDIMEQGLLNLDVGAADSEVINSIFRSAHSIKGGSGTFGFTDIAEFTHVMETILDEMRDGQRAVTQGAVDILLQAGDCLREMLSAAQSGDDVDHGRVAKNKQEMDQLLAGDTEVRQTHQIVALETDSGNGSGWKIVFQPHAHLMRSGNDPLRMIRALAELGELCVQANTARLPEFIRMEPEDSYLSWNMELRGDIARDDVNEIFEWVDGDCDLNIQPLESDSKDITQHAPQATANDNVIPIVGERRDGDRRSSQDRRTTPAAQGGGSIRVDIDKIDSLINMVGELVITQSMLSLLGEDFHMDRLDRLNTGLAQLERHSRELQESVMRIRMLPISFVFSRFPRLVRDLSGQLNKKIELKISGEQTELDKAVIEQIGDPLVHLVRNSLDHGIETPEIRKAQGKPETGIVNLNAYHQGGSIVIEIKDDGAGLDREKILHIAIERGLVSHDETLPDEKIYELIMQPGFSTAEVVTDVSGRGVGMDVVRKNILSLGGNIEIQSAVGMGSTFTVRLPLTLAILDGQSVAVGDESYIVPLMSIVESIQVKPEMVNLVVGKGEVFKLRDEYIPIIRLADVFEIDTARVKNLEEGLLVVVEGDGRKCGLFVDELLGQQQVVIKSLETNFKRMHGISGATILGDGSVALILDIPGIVRLAAEQ